MNIIIKSLFFILGCLALAACQSTGIASGNSVKSSETTREATEYVLGSGDQLRIIVFGEENLSGEFVVDSSGFISMPLIGEVAAGQKSIREFQRSVESKLLDGYLKDPRVSAEVLNFRPYYILGEVTTSGEYPFSNGLTVLNAVATAGGFTYRANTKVVYIKRAGEQNEVQYPLTVSTAVQPGDTIRVAERLF
ncbi:MAG: polysaccharide export protein [Hyphomonadaceae bacterium]|nr:polysaccharide export protein [Hyphomonadaceae bacterium]